MLLQFIMIIKFKQPFALSQHLVSTKFGRFQFGHTFLHLQVPSTTTGTSSIWKLSVKLNLSKPLQLISAQYT